MQILLSTYNIHRADTNFENYLIFLKQLNQDCILCIQEDLDSHRPERRKDNPTRLSCEAIASKYGYYLCNNKQSQDECCCSVYAPIGMRGIITQEVSNSHRHAIFSLLVSSTIKLAVLGVHAPSQLTPDQNKLYLQQDLKKEIEGLNTEYIVVMGDLNANPFSESIATAYGLDAKPVSDEVNILCNPCWMFGPDNIRHTYFHKERHNPTRYNIFDQILLTNQLRKTMSFIEVVKQGSTILGVPLTSNLNSDHHPLICQIEVK